MKYSTGLNLIPNVAWEFKAGEKWAVVWVFTGALCLLGEKGLWQGVERHKLGNYYSSPSKVRTWNRVLTTQPKEN
jgi:hypothetical protein